MPLKRIRPLEPHHVLILRSGAMGDTLMLLPALVWLSNAFRVLFAGRQPGLNFLDGVVSQTMNLETAGWHRLFVDAPIKEWKVALPIHRLDRIIAFSADETKTLEKNLRTLFPSAAVFMYPPFPPQSQSIHVAQYLTRCLHSAKLPLDEKKIMKAAASRPTIRGPRRRDDRYRLVIHPGSGNPKKNHPPDFWAGVIDRLMRLPRFAHLRPVLLFGPAENDMVTVLTGQVDPAHNPEVFLSPSKDALLGVLGSAGLYLGHDSGVTHLSALMGTPTVALFRCTDATQWRPLGPRVHVIQRDASDLKCLQLIIEAAKQF